MWAPAKACGCNILNSPSLYTEMKKHFCLQQEGMSQTNDTPSSFFYWNRSLFGIFAIYLFLNFSKNAMESLEKPWPFQVEVLVMRIQH